jgi:hypothetical protein
MVIEMSRKYAMLTESREDILNYRAWLSLSVYNFRQCLYCYYLILLNITWKHYPSAITFSCKIFRLCLQHTSTKSHKQWFFIELLSKKFPTIMHRLIILKRYYKVIPFSDMFQWWPQTVLSWETMLLRT